MRVYYPTCRTHSVNTLMNNSQLLIFSKVYNSYAKGRGLTTTICFLEIVAIYNYKASAWLSVIVEFAK